MRLTAILGMVFCMATGHAQDLDINRLRDSFNDIRKSMRADFEDFRSKCMSDFTDFVRNPWKEFEQNAPKPVPEEKPVPPVVMPEEDKDTPVEDTPVVIEEVVEPAPVVPQPEPVEPIKEVPVLEEKKVAFTFYGTTANVRFDISARPRLSGVDNNSIADAFEDIKQDEYDNMIVDCLNLRKQLHLSDWAYLQMLNSLSQKICGGNSNESALLLAYLYMQSGYKMRLASDGNKLYMLYASRHLIYGQPAYEQDGELYYGLGQLPERLRICEASFPKEQSLSLQIPQSPDFAWSGGDARTLKSTRYPDMEVKSVCNKNMIDFYSSYPSSEIDGNFMTHWAMYANTPMEEGVREELYPALRSHIAGLSKKEAVERLLNWVQTGFEYEYDDKVWGGERAFFPEESLYYPYCDCEDRSILFTRLVRDLLGLKCVLVYYPGHLASAVCFDGETVNGDYISLNGNRYVVCDPTYINASAGRTMPGMDNASAKVILLK